MDGVHTLARTPVLALEPEPGLFVPAEEVDGSRLQLPVDDHHVASTVARPAMVHMQPRTHEGHREPVTLGLASLSLMR
jgi:hypothetical protein